MVSLKLQKRLAAEVLKCGKRKVWLDPNEVNEISMANSSKWTKEKELVTTRRWKKTWRETLLSLARARGRGTVGVGGRGTPRRLATTERTARPPRLSFFPSFRFADPPSFPLSLSLSFQGKTSVSSSRTVS